MPRDYSQDRLEQGFEVYYSVDDLGLLDGFTPVDEATPEIEEAYFWARVTAVKVIKPGPERWEPVESIKLLAVHQGPAEDLTMQHSADYLGERGEVFRSTPAGELAVRREDG